MFKRKMRNDSSGSPDEIKSKICCLRVSFIVSMIAAAAICGSIAFKYVQRLELDSAEQSFYSIAAAAIKGAQAITRRKIQGNEIMSSMISYRFPDSSSYPFVALPGYVEISSKVKELSTSLLGFSLIVTPDQVADFEAFAAKTYQEQEYPEGAGVSDFGFGIWRNDDDSSLYSDHRVHDTNGDTTYGGKYDIIVPLLHHSNISTTILLYNVYSENITGPAIDSIIDCSKASNVSGTTPKCITLTNFVELKAKSGPSAVLMQPVYPANDPTNVVGFSTAPLVWEDVLNDVVPDSVNGLYCVISSESESYTYNIENGRPKLLGKGDLHDTAYNSYGKAAIISAVDGISSSASTYTLTVYPSDELFDTKHPWSLAIGFVLVIAACAAIFFVYDFLMRNEARQRKVIIEMKRRFVRFVSHEIRTPLNTVCLGLELLQSDLNSSSLDENNEEPEGTFPSQHISDNNKILQCANLVDDILENANNAVGILNDLLNYDKMEQGTFNLEVTVVPIWDLIVKTVSSFDIQAKKKSMQLTSTIERPSNEDGSSPDLSRLCVVGDDVRLRQVIRNVISNSLKFSPESTGKISVTLMHNPDGLPNASTPREDIFHDTTSNTLACSYPRAGAIKIIVEDNGVGLSPAQLQRIFQEGVQFEPNKLQDGGGSGLGLHITKGLVEKHGGTIQLLSEGQNNGCTAIIELPLYEYPLRILSLSMQHSAHSGRSARSAPSNDIVVSLPTKTTACQKRSRSCLVVDDSLPNRKMLVRLLERAGHTCKWACHGEEAIDVMEVDRATALRDESHVPIDTILMDYEMPILNGPDATKMLRENGCNALILGVTGNVLTEDISYFISMGADKVLPKPVNMALIQECWDDVRLTRAV